MFRHDPESLAASCCGPRASGGVPSRGDGWPDVIAWSPRERGCSAPRLHHGPARKVVPARAGVFRSWRSQRPSRCCGPRASGGVPGHSGPCGLPPAWSPRERGCSGTRTHRPQRRCVVPARAGVFRPWRAPCTAPRGGPRASGGVPYPAGSRSATARWSPRERGCSALHRRGRIVEAVVPARAGVFRWRSACRRPRRSGPRASGGVPAQGAAGGLLLGWSPRERGCSGAPMPELSTARVVPARAGVFRATSRAPIRASRGPRASGGVPMREPSWDDAEVWSPRERGCSAPDRPESPPCTVVPARAGVFRNRRSGRGCGRCGPRASGGVPVELLRLFFWTSWSPRERGCSARIAVAHTFALVVPARAGVFRHADSPRAWCRCGPRASGGVPLVVRAAQPLGLWSPRERGCSGGQASTVAAAPVVPARAGVFRSRTPAQTFRSGGPRASGGVPVSADASQPGQEWSPRERGCSELSGFDVCVGIVVPARAGVFRPRSSGGIRPVSGPRASGGVPAYIAGLPGNNRWSPRERGCSAHPCTRHHPLRVVPARAGVFRRSRSARAAWAGGPRASGGVPEPTAPSLREDPWSPRERGCSGGGHAVGGARVVPARAWVFRKPPMTALPGQRGPRASGGGPLTRDGARRGWWSPRAGVFQLRQCA